MADGLGNCELASRSPAHATTELVRWLERDYKLSANEAAIVAGSSMRYEIAEVVDPLVHVVAKVNKEVLATLK